MINVISTYKITENDFRTTIRVKATCQNDAIQHYCKSQLLADPVWLRICTDTLNQFYEVGSKIFQVAYISEGEY